MPPKINVDLMLTPPPIDNIHALRVELMDLFLCILLFFFCYTADKSVLTYSSNVPVKVILLHFTFPVKLGKKSDFWI